MNNLSKSLKFLRKKLDFNADTALVLGSGLNVIADRYFEKQAEIDYKDIPDFPTPTVKDHKGKLIAGYFDKTPCYILQGRVHYYEGNTSQKAVIPIRLMYLLGVKNIILTNASGGISFLPGEIMLIKDHILFNVPSPLIGKNLDNFGVRFPDMTYMYDIGLRETAKKIALSQNIELKEGVYLQCSGPQFETPAEIRMFKMWGADAVGMSTAVETIAARHCGLKVLGLSFIANYAAGISKEIISSEDVNTTVGNNIEKAGKLIKDIVKTIG